MVFNSEFALFLSLRLFFTNGSVVL
uniref:Uncharacterized protein n=1 Tax=Arundo donax TaxID=35708 RepID=A0A0A8YCM3_ARUDO